MPMDLEGLLEKIVAELGSYFTKVFGILRYPESAFILGKHETNLSSSKAFIYAVISAVIGTSFLKLLLSREEEITISTVLVPVAFWVFEGAFLYLICKALRGRGTFARTLSGILQVYGVVYVLSACLGLCTWALLKTVAHYSAAIRASELLAHLIDSPVLCFYLFDLALSAFYVPMMLGGVHGFGRIRKATLIAFALIGIGISFCAYVATESIPIRESETERILVKPRV